LRLKTFQSMSVSCTQLSAVQKKSVQSAMYSGVCCSYRRLMTLTWRRCLNISSALFRDVLLHGQAKTNKALLMHHLENKVTDPRKPPDDSSFAVIDGNAIIHACSGLPETFGDLAWQIFCCLPKSGDVHFFHRLLSWGQHQVFLSVWSDTLHRGEQSMLQLIHVAVSVEDCRKTWRQWNRHQPFACIVMSMCFVNKQAVAVWPPPGAADTLCPRPCSIIKLHRPL